jgi:hypothetical protein
MQNRKIKKNVGTCNNSFSLQKLPPQESVSLFDSAEFWNQFSCTPFAPLFGTSAQRQRCGCLFLDRDEHFS